MASNLDSNLDSNLATNTEPVRHAALVAHMASVSGILIVFSGPVQHPSFTATTPASRSRTMVESYRLSIILNFDRLDQSPDPVLRTFADTVRAKNLLSWPNPQEVRFGVYTPLTRRAYRLSGGRIDTNTLDEIGGSTWREDLVCVGDWHALHQLLEERLPIGFWQDVQAILNQRGQLVYGTTKGFQALRSDRIMIAL